MKGYDPQIVEVTMYQMFPPEWVRGTARETGLVKRERKVDPVVMLWALTLSFGVRLQRTLASPETQLRKGRQHPFER